LLNSDQNFEFGSEAKVTKQAKISEEVSVIKYLPFKNFLFFLKLQGKKLRSTVYERKNKTKILKGRIFNKKFMEKYMVGYGIIPDPDENNKKGSDPRPQVSQVHGGVRLGQQLRLQRQ